MISVDHFLLVRIRWSVFVGCSLVVVSWVHHKQIGFSHFVIQQSHFQRVCQIALTELSVRMGFSHIDEVKLLELRVTYAKTPY